MPNISAALRRRSPLAAVAVAVAALLGASACAEPLSPERAAGGARADLVPIYGGPAPTLLLGAFPQIVGGQKHSCALRRDYVVLCWGYNYYGQLGRGGVIPGTSSNTPVEVAGGITFKQIAAGLLHTCGLDRDGKAYCWGGPAYGEIGDGGGSPRPSPSAVAGGLTFKAITAGRRHSCAITTEGAAYCWGFEEFGQLGNGQMGYTSEWTPVAVSGGNAFKAISAGSDHTCALTTTGVAMCWGYGAALGNGSNAHSAVPVFVAGGYVFSSIDAGGYSTCATTSAGVGYCWGDNSAGQLGALTLRNPVLSPVRVGASYDFFQRIDVGGNRACGIRKAGTMADSTYNVACWGTGWAGQLGYGGTEGGYTLRLVESDSAGGDGFRAIGLGSEHSCGITRSGGAYCWGRGDDGQVGTVTPMSINLVPHAVAGGYDFSW